MNKLYGIAIFGTMFFGIGWIFIRTTWTLVGCIICLLGGWITLKIQEENS